MALFFPFGGCLLLPLVMTSDDGSLISHQKYARLSSVLRRRTSWSSSSDPSDQNGVGRRFFFPRRKNPNIPCLFFRLQLSQTAAAPPSFADPSGMGNKLGHGNTMSAEFDDPAAAAAACVQRGPALGVSASASASLSSAAAHRGGHLLQQPSPNNGAGAASGGACAAEDGEDQPVEVPPPMQPIASIPGLSSASAGSSDDKVPKSPI